MKCSEIEEILPGYLDNALTDEERVRIEEHLAGCPECRESLAYLRSAVELAGSMQKVAPPARFKQEIMARVREEAAGKKGQGFLRRFFSPFPMKIPVQAFATVFIVVLAFYLFRVAGPGVQKPEGQPALTPGSPQVLTHVPPGVQSAPAKAGPEAVKPARERTAEPMKKRKGPAGEAMDAKALKGAGSPPEQGMFSPAPASPPQAALDMPAAEVGAAAEDTVAPQEIGRASRQAEKLKSLPKAEAAGRGIREEGLKDASVSPSMLPAINVALIVPDLDEGVKSIENILAGLHARVASRRMQAGRVVLVAEIPGRQVEDYLNKAGAIGKMEGKVDAGSLPEGFVSVSTELKSNPE